MATATACGYCKAVITDPGGHRNYHLENEEVPRLDLVTDYNTGETDTGTTITFQDEAVDVVAATVVNFTGAGVVVTDVGGVATVTIASGGSGITVEDEDVSIGGLFTILNFTGSGVTATDAGGGQANITIDPPASGWTDGALIYTSAANRRVSIGSNPAGLSWLDSTALNVYSYTDMAGGAVEHLGIRTAIVGSGAGVSGGFNYTTAQSANVATDYLKGLSISGTSVQTIPVATTLYVEPPSAGSNTTITTALAARFTGAARFDTHMESAEVSAPGTPASGFGRWYVKTDGKPYFKNDGGTEYDLSGTTGGAAFWTRAGGAIYPTTTADQLVVNSTAAANQERLHVNPIASLAGDGAMKVLGAYIPAVTTNFTTAQSGAVYRNRMDGGTITGTSVQTIPDAATLYLASAPAAGANTTLTKTWTLWVDDGVTRLDGVLDLRSDLNFGVADAGNIVAGTATGVQIATSTSQKLGFFGTTPRVQPSGANANLTDSSGGTASTTIAAAGAIYSQTNENDFRASITRAVKVLYDALKVSSPGLGIISS